MRIIGFSISSLQYTLRQVNDIGKRNPKRKTQPGSRRFGHYTEQ